MKIEIKGFLETSFVDWPGKICSVVFLPRCNFRCPYCHNHPLVFHPEQIRSLSWEEILGRLHSFRDWIDGLCITGGEPTLHPDLPLLVRDIRSHGLLVKVDTNGSNPALLEKLLEAGDLDFVSMDVKAPLDPVHYQRSAGCYVDLGLLRRSITLLKEGTVEYQFRMTVVPGLHSEEDVKKVADQLQAGSRLVLQNFNPENPLDPSLKRTRPFDPEDLKRIEREIGGSMEKP
jgi:pyruvate formate lyase activating enzyme